MMRWPQSAGLGWLVVLLGSLALADDPGAGIPLFNGKDLAGWEPKVDTKASGYDPNSSADRVFTVEGGMIRVSGERLGTLTTVAEYADYKLRFEFRWGEKRWAPRAQEVRDTGVLLHCTGPAKIWTKSIECQIQEHDCGDFWMVDGTTLKFDGKVEKSYKKKVKDAEKPTGEWNTVEVICDGGSITNIINGEVVNRGTDASVTRGKILLQSEGAEVYFRNLVLTPLKAK